MKTQQELNNELIDNAKYGNLDIVKSLIEQGVDIEAKDIYEDDDTALMWSSLKGHLEIVKYLIEQGANVNAKNKNGYTALIWSAYNGHIDIIKYLIENSADINVENHYGHTALILSFRYEHLEIVNYLIPYIYDYKAFEKIYNELEIEQKHILFEHFMNNRELLEQVNPRIMKNFIPDINEYKNNLK